MSSPGSSLAQDGSVGHHDQPLGDGRIVADYSSLPPSAQRTHIWSSSAPHIGLFSKLPTRLEASETTRRLTSGTTVAASSIWRYTCGHVVSSAAAPADVAASMPSSI